MVVEFSWLPEKWLISSRINVPKGPFTRVIFCSDFLLLTDVNEWINNECAFVTGLLVHIRQKEKIALEILKAFFCQNCL